MKFECIKGSIAIIALFIITASCSHASLVFEHIFDGSSSVPSVQQFANTTGTVSSNLSTGEISTSNFAAAGFNTSAAFDLSGFSGFSVEFVLDAGSSFATKSNNGTFFGVVNSSNANSTGPSALYNSGGSLGLQLGLDRGDQFANISLVDGGRFYADLSPATVTAPSPYSVTLTYTPDGAGTQIHLQTSGLSTDFNTTITSDDISSLGSLDFATFAGNITPNVSAQNGTLNLASIKITGIPEVSSVSCVFGWSLLCFYSLRRKRVRVI